MLHGDWADEGVRPTICDALQQSPQLGLKLVQRVRRRKAPLCQSGAASAASANAGKQGLEQVGGVKPGSR